MLIPCTAISIVDTHADLNIYDASSCCVGTATTSNAKCCSNQDNSADQKSGLGNFDINYWVGTYRERSQKVFPALTHDTRVFQDLCD